MNRDEQNLHDVFNHADDLPPEVEAAMRTQLDELRRKMQPEAAIQADTRPEKENWIMSLLNPKRAPWRFAAVALIVICAGVFFTLNTGGGGGGGSMAYASVIQKFRTIRTASYTMQMQGGQLPAPVSLELSYMDPGKMRINLPGGVLSIADFPAGKMMSLVPQTRMCLVYNLDSMPEEQRRLNQIDQLRKLPIEADVSMPNQILDGRLVTVHGVDQSGIETTIWTDQDTGELIRIETGVPGADDMQVVMTDFEFDVELDPADFELNAPEGYEMVDVDLDLSRPTEKDLVNFFQFWLDCSPEGRFPEEATIGYITAQMVKHPELFQKYFDQAGTNRKGYHGDESKALLQKSMDLTMQFQRGLLFIQELETDKREFHYAGKNKTRGDGSQWIAWWQKEDKSGYRVMLDDLSIVDATDEEAAQHP